MKNHNFIYEVVRVIFDRSLKTYSRSPTSIIKCKQGQFFLVLILFGETDAVLKSFRHGYFSSILVV